MPNDWRAYVAIGAVAVVLVWLAKKQIGAVANAVNPLNDNNVFAAAGNDLGAALTGDSNFSLGKWFETKVNGPMPTISK